MENISPKKSANSLKSTYSGGKPQKFECIFGGGADKDLSRLWVLVFLMFALTLVLNQLDEILDLPNLLFGAKATPVNYTEMLIEGVSIVFVGLICVLGVRRLAGRQIRSQMKISHLNLLMTSVSRVGRLLEKEKNKEKLISDICEALTSEGSYCLSWIALLDESQRVNMMAQSGMPDKAALTVSESDIKIPACLKKIMQTEEVCVLDRNNPECMKCGLHTYNPENVVLLVSLRHHKRVYGMLGVSSKYDLAVEKEEQNLLKEAARDIALALWGMEAGSHQARAEQALMESENRYRIVLESSPHGILLTEMDTLSITYANPAMCEMLGYTEDEISSLSMRDIHPPEDFDAVIKELEGKFSGEKTHSIDIRCLGKDGKCSQVILNCEQVLIEGRPHVVGFFNDISSHKMLEEQLNQSQKLEAVGRLAGGVAHDFNNLLSVIITFSGFALESLSDKDPLHGDILEIRKAGERAAVLTRQLLAFSRKQVLKPQVLELNKVVTGMEGMLRRLIGEDIELISALSSDTGRVKADPGQIEQIIMNLAVNSRDAMPDGGKLIIEAANVELDQEYANQHVSVQPGPHVMLSISDTGCGMDEETRQHIFEPFFTTKETGKGTGLGMSTVYGFVKQSGGNIWVYSELGRGTTIKIFLPRILELPEEETIAKKQQITRSKGDRTVLVVEDDQAVRSLVKRVLENAGFNIITASNGDEAICACERSTGKIDLLLTDVIMPQMNGRELSERIGKSCPEMRVLFMSGYTDNAIASHGVLEPGMNFIGKPFTAADLSAKVSEIIGDNQENGDTGMSLPPPSPEIRKNFVQS